MSERPLYQDLRMDEPGLIGARWWQDGVVDPVERRRRVLAVLGVGLGLGAAGFAFEALTRNETTDDRRNALGLQRVYGWSFGAATEALVFNGTSTEPFDAARLGTMVEDLAPRVPSHRPYYVSTLFESPRLLPQATSEADTAPIPPLKSALRPILTSEMQHTFSAGQTAMTALSAIPNAAVVVDLDGPNSVAFAAGASALFDPVFLFDNWPHPRGVVPAHMTLAAAAYYQPMLTKAAQTGPRDSPAMFVLDRRRLSSYTDSSSEFDNRWVARMPGASALRSLGIKHLLYIAPSYGDRELDDLNDDFVGDHAAGITFRVFDAQSIGSTLPGSDSVPIPRRTQFSSGVAGGGRPTPGAFGTVPVLLAAATGTLLGVAWSRSGTWNRAGGG